MSLLLNPKALIGLVLAVLLAFSHFTAYRKGAAHVRQEWSAAVATASSEARKLEQQRQRRADEAAKIAAEREGRIRADAVRVSSERDGLRDDLRAVREHARQSLDACTVSLSAATDVFQSCADRYSELAEEADRHANDSVRLQNAWPR